MRTYRKWREDRLRRDEEAVLAAIRMLRPSRASGWPIMRLAHLGSGRTYVALARLEKTGRLTSEWVLTPGRAFPRRRVYREVVADRSAEVAQ